MTLDFLFSFYFIILFFFGVMGKHDYLVNKVKQLSPATIFFFFNFPGHGVNNIKQTYIVVKLKSKSMTK